MSPLSIWAAVLVAPNLGFPVFTVFYCILNVKQPQEWEIWALNWHSIVTPLVCEDLHPLEI